MCICVSTWVRLMSSCQYNLESQNCLEGVNTDFWAPPRAPAVGGERTQVCISSKDLGMPVLLVWTFFKISWQRSEWVFTGGGLDLVKGSLGLLVGRGHRCCQTSGNALGTAPQNKTQCIMSLVLTESIYAHSANNYLSDPNTCLIGLLCPLKRQGFYFKYVTSSPIWGVLKPDKCCPLHYNSKWITNMVLAPSA